MMYVIFGFLILAPLGVRGQMQDPCQEGYYVYPLDNQDGHRSKGFIPDYSYSLKCDLNDVFDGKWHRFESPVCNQLARGPVPRGRCGTYIPIWLPDGVSHPDLNSAVDYFDVSVCAEKESGKPCSWNATILGKRCVGQGGAPYFVYRLRTPPSCYMAYCAGDSYPCLDSTTAAMVINTTSATTTTSKLETTTASTPTTEKPEKPTCRFAVLGVVSSNSCDRSQISCDQVTLDMAGLTSSSILCKVSDFVMVGGEIKQIKSHVTEGQVEGSTGLVTCPVKSPDDVFSNLLSVSQDGGYHYSAAVWRHLYNSSCQICDVATDTLGFENKCRLKSEKCMIGGKCVDARTRPFPESCWVCDPYVDRYNWSRDSAHMPPIIRSNGTVALARENPYYRLHYAPGSGGRVTYFSLLQTTHTCLRVYTGAGTLDASHCVSLTDQPMMFHVKIRVYDACDAATEIKLVVLMPGIDQHPPSPQAGCQGHSGVIIGLSLLVGVASAAIVFLVLLRCRWQVVKPTADKYVYEEKPRTVFFTQPEEKIGL